MKHCTFFLKSCSRSIANSTGGRECAAHHGMALEPLVPIGNMIEDKKIPWSTKHYIAPLLLELILCFCELASAMHHFHRFTIFSHITNNLGSSGGMTLFCKIHVGGCLKLKMNVQMPHTTARPDHCYQFWVTLVFTGQYLETSMCGTPGVHCTDGTEWSAF